MATKKEYKTILNMAGGVPEKVEQHSTLVAMLAAHILRLEKRIEKLENRSIKS